MKKHHYLIITLVVCLITSTIFITTHITNNINQIGINDKLVKNKTANNNQSSLPKLSIIGDITNMIDKTDIRTVKIDYQSSDMNFSSYATFKLQGQYSLDYPKKNYNISFFKDEEKTEKEYINLKWGAFNKYTLKANWTDDTHSRNIVCSNIAGDINNKYGYFTNTPNNGVIDGFPIEIYVNDKFHGLYTLNLHKENMFNEENNNNYTLISNQTDYGMRDVIEETLEWKNFEVEVGNEDQQTLDNFNRMLNFVHTSSDEIFKKDIEKYFNLDSLLNYYCYIKFADLWDNVGKNLYFLSYDGQIWYTVFYDLDYSYGSNYTYAESKQKIKEFIEMFPIWNKLERNFNEELAIRWEELRKDIFTYDYAVNKFETYYNAIPKEILKQEKNKWPATQNYSIPRLKKFLNVRIPDSDKFFNSLKTGNNNNDDTENSKPIEKPSDKPNNNQNNNDTNNKPSGKPDNNVSTIKPSPDNPNQEYIEDNNNNTNTENNNNNDNNNDNVDNENITNDDENDKIKKPDKDSNKDITFNEKKEKTNNKIYIILTSISTIFIVIVASFIYIRRKKRLINKK